MTIVLHLTHTSVPHDSRILKELNALSQSPDLNVHAYGVMADASRGAQHSVPHDSRILQRLGARGKSPEVRVPADHGLLAESPQTQRTFTLRQFRLRSARRFLGSRTIRYALVLLEVNTLFLAHLLKLRPDIVHCHDTMVLPSGVLARALLRSTLVYDAHELESDKAGQSRALSGATLLIEKISWPHIDRLITVSPSIARWYVEHLGPKPTLCILNAPEIPTERKRVAEAPGSGLRDRLGVGPQAPLFVYVGALESGRGIELLLETFAGWDAGAHVAFIGSGGLRETIERVAQFEGNVHYCPPVPHERLVAHIQEATGGFCLIEDVSLSDRYCLPNKLFEYAFAGLPVIASRLPDIERFVRQYQLGVCADLNVISVREAILECIERPTDLPMERLERLSWESQAGVLRGLYTESRNLQPNPPFELPSRRPTQNK